ncbi:MAG: hypothetical protein KF901_17605 [Myxococcales bacterium]|nr:hypothetical protein [Myxococcales bacterium]
MPSEPYRTSYRVEETTRALRATELAFVRARREERAADVHKQEMSGPREMVIPLTVAVIAFAVGLAIDDPAVMFAGAGMAVMLAGIFVIARRRALERVAAYPPGPWALPDEAYSVREIHIVARSVVGAASGDEDYVIWALFEIPGGRWVYLDPLSVPLDGPVARLEALARADVRLTQLLPHGLFLSATVAGDAIPHRGAGGGAGEDYADAMERGFEWRPSGPIDAKLDEHGGDDDSSLEPGPIGRVAEDVLPARIREVVQG